MTNWIQITKHHDPALYETVREIAIEDFENLDMYFRAYLDLRDGRVVVVYGKEGLESNQYLGRVRTVARLSLDGPTIQLGRGVPWNADDGSVLDVGVVPFEAAIEQADKRARAVFGIDADVLPYESIAVPS